MPNQVIAATWLTCRGDAVLAVRPHGLDAYFLPGGIPESGDGRDTLIWPRCDGLKWPRLDGVSMLL
ncbi:MAG: hypothetical protein ACTHPS_13345 [Streptosporangiaceae bacterium]